MTDMTDMTDLHARRFTRLRVRCLFEIRGRQGSYGVCRDGHITVVSERGGFVEIGGDYAVGTHVMLQFGSPLIDEVICVGVVRHLEPHMGIDVGFFRLSDTDRKHLGGLVRGRGKGSGDVQPDTARFVA